MEYFPFEAVGSNVPFGASEVVDNKSPKALLYPQNPDTEFFQKKVDCGWLNRYELIYVLRFMRSYDYGFS